MVNYGITDTGFVIKPIDVIEDEFKELLKAYFGSNVDLTQQSPLWKSIQVPAAEISQLWVYAENSFYNNFINSANGIALDLLSEDIGLERKDAISAGVTLTITKNTSSAVTVPQYSLFQTSEGIIFSTDIEIQIDVGDPATETGDVVATAVIGGVDGNVGLNTILTPTNTITGVDSSDNAAAADGGADIETDTALRKRVSKYIRATWTRDAIRAAALDVEGVTSVKIIEEATSYKCLIVPATTFDSALQTEVEEAIEKVTPITVEYSVLEAESVEIDVTGNITIESTYDENSAEADAEIEIREYLQTLAIDDDVINARIVQAIMEVVGIIDTWTVVLVGKPIEETHEYDGTAIVALDYPTGVDTAAVVVTGFVSSSPVTFTKGVDYQILTSPARIDWGIGGLNPDNPSDFKITYTFPADAKGNIVVDQEDIAVFGSVDFTVV